MSILSLETHGRHRAEHSSRNVLKASEKLGKVGITTLVSRNESSSSLDQADYIEVEEKLSHLNYEAEELLHEQGRLPRQTRKELVRHAMRLLEITDEQPELLNTRSIDLIGFAADSSGNRGLLRSTLDQARINESMSDTDIALQAIKVALERDVPFQDVIRSLNHEFPAEIEVDAAAVPIEKEFDWLFDANAPQPTKAYPMPRNQSDSPSRPLFRDEK